MPTNIFQTQNLAFDYTESTVEKPVLWENHCHTQFEIILVLEGDVNIMLEGRCYRLEAEQGVIIPPLYYHAVTANRQGSYRRVTARFELSAVPAVLQPHFSNKDAHLRIFRTHLGHELRALCAEEDPALFEPLAHSLMIRILYKDIRGELSDTEVETDPFLRRIIRYIDAHPHEKILLDDLAAHVSRSKSSVCHLFEEKMNISPKQYILQKKLTLAHKLILDGTPPTLAAMQVGYDNYSNFYRMYKKFIGTSPSNRK